MTRSPLTSFAGEVLPGIGHNQGPPLTPGHGFRVHAWKKARAQLMPKLPLEILKRRVARARELGLDYPQYASILLGTGRDVLGFLFTCDAIGMRLRRDGAASLPVEVAQKLGGLGGVERILMIPASVKPIDLGPILAEELIRRHGAAPRDQAAPGEARQAVRALLDPAKLPSDAVVMIGTDPKERGWAEAARLAKFLPSDQFFR